VGSNPTPSAANEVSEEGGAEPLFSFE